MLWVLRRNTFSSRPRLTNSDLNGFSKRSMSVSILEHLFMSSHTALGSPAIVASSKYQMFKFDLMKEAVMNSEGR